MLSTFELKEPTQLDIPLHSLCNICTPTLNIWPSIDKSPLTIAAIICQQPKIQGSKPLSLLFAYLTTGETPEKEYNYTAVDIRIKENL